MSSRFDERINRKNTDSIKYDFALEFDKQEDMIPLWVADMDFQAPGEVLDALKRRIEHGIFGYSDTKEEYYLAIADWFLHHFAWRPKKEWLVKSPGVVFGLNQVLRAVTKEGEAVLIQPPVYHPFFTAVESNGRTLIENPLQYQEGIYSIDFDDFEAKIKKYEVKLFILCSPHNPVGRVWTREELTRIGNICLENNVIVFSDEIHCDFTYGNNQHLVFASLSEACSENCVVATAPSKTFNLAGLQTSTLFIKNEVLREQVLAQMQKNGVDGLNGLGLVACQAAYEHGEPWLLELKEYLAGNLSMIRDFLAEKIPQIKIIEPQGTYLLWLDCSGLMLSKEALTAFMEQEAGLWLNEGSVFGEAYGQFVRLNMGCPRSLLEEAMNRLGSAVERLEKGQEKQ